MDSPTVSPKNPPADGPAGMQAEGAEQEPEAPPQPGPMCLTRVKGSRTAHELVLEAGDMIISVNGNSWARLRSVERAIAALVDTGAVPVVLSIWRNGKMFEVLTDTKPDGAWTVVDPVEAQVMEGTQPVQRRLVPRQYSRYAVYADPLHVADVVELRTSLLAMIAPPLWFVSRRLWEALAAFLCIVLTASAIAPVFGLCIYVALCLYVGRKQVALVQFAMTREGKRKAFVLAARSEPDAQQIALQFNDKFHFKFGPRLDAKSTDVDIGLI